MKKDFYKHFDEVEAQYLESMQDLREMEESLQDGLVNPEMYEKLKMTVNPILTTYYALVGVRILLEKPRRKNKKSKWEKKNAERILQARTSDKVINENNKALNGLKEYKD